MYLMYCKYRSQSRNELTPGGAGPGQENFQCKDETQKIQIIGRIY